MVWQPDTHLVKTLTTLLRGLGYSYGAVHWCTDGHGAGYAGVAIFSKVPCSFSRGMHKTSSFNRTGRVITAHFTGIDIVNSYTPTTHTDDSKDARRLLYDTEFSQFLASLSRTPILCGDLNTAPDFTDCTLWVAPSKSNEPASKEFELKAHTDMVTSLGLIDCYKECHTAPWRQSAATWTTGLPS